MAPEAVAEVVASTGLASRLRTAAFLIAGLVAVLLVGTFTAGGQFFLRLVALLVVLGAGAELYWFVRVKGQHWCSGLPLLCAASVLPVAEFFIGGLGSIVLAGLVLQFGVVLAVELLWSARNAEVPTSNFFEMLIVSLLVGGGGAALIYFSGKVAVLLWLIIVVSVNDSSAYFVGRWIGRFRIAPSISPNKTLAGSVAGVSAGVGIAILIWYAEAWLAFQSSNISIYKVILVVLAAQLGDLTKSSLKRRYSVKDSSNILPGHGGVLDRIDGIMAGALVLVVFEAF